MARSWRGRASRRSCEYASRKTIDKRLVMFARLASREIGDADTYVHFLYRRHRTAEKHPHNQKQSAVKGSKDAILQLGPRNIFVVA